MPAFCLKREPPGAVNDKNLAFKYPNQVFNGIVFLISFLLNCCAGHGQTTSVYENKRLQMVKWQIEARGISDKRVLNAMLKVERHLFVPSSQAASAYEDSPLPIGYDQTISQPYIVAFMTEALQLKETDRVLEVGTGSGYQAAVLAEICDSVYTVEVVRELGLRAKALLTTLGYGNIKVKIGDGYQGWPEHSPFQAIIVTCSPTHVPEPLVQQLDEGGRMIIPVGERNSQHLYMLEKQKGKLIQRSVLPVRFVPMVDENKKEY